MRQIGLGVQQYHATHNQFPPGFPPYFAQSPFVAILPYLDNVPLHDSYNFGQSPHHISNLTTELGRLAILICPSDAGSADILSAGPNAFYPTPDPPLGSWPRAVSSYGFMFGSVAFAFESRPDPTADPMNQMNGMFNCRLDLNAAAVTDGLSTTVFAAERALSVVNQNRITPLGKWTAADGATTLMHAWVAPNSMFKYRHDGRFWSSTAPGDGASSLHPGGVHVLFGDNSVRFIRDGIDSWPPDPANDSGGGPGGAIGWTDGSLKLPKAGVWQALATRAGGEIVAADQY